MEIAEIEKGQDDYFIIYVDLKDAVTEREDGELYDNYLYYNTSNDSFRLYFREPVYYVNDFQLIDMCISEPTYLLLSQEESLIMHTSSGEVTIPIIPDFDGAVTIQGLATALRSHCDVVVQEDTLLLSSGSAFSLTIGSGLVDYFENSFLESADQVPASTIQLTSVGTMPPGSVSLISSGSSSGTFSSGTSEQISSGIISGTVEFPGSIQTVSSGFITNTNNYKLSIKLNLQKTKELLGNLMFHCEEVESKMPHPPLYKKMQGLYKFVWNRRYLPDITDHNQFSPIQKVLEFNFNFESRNEWNINHLLYQYHAFAEFTLRISYKTISKTPFQTEIEGLANTLRETILSGVDTVTKPSTN